VRDQVEIQMEEMLRRGDVFTVDHVMYYQKDGGRHDFDAVQEYIYNALPLFFN
jgi:endo-1,4-beta-xylanase